jgi:hypothetical protein
LKPKHVPAKFRANRHVYYYSADDCHRIADWLNRTPALERAKKFLRKDQENGPVAYKELKSRAAAEGVRLKSLDAARRELGIKSTRVGNPVGGVTYWRRPGQRLPNAEPDSFTKAPTSKTPPIDPGSISKPKGSRTVAREKRSVLGRPPVAQQSPAEGPSGSNLPERPVLVRREDYTATKCSFPANRPVFLATGS